MNKYEAAPLIEVFSSIQGEGMLVGLRQVFIRFHGCNLCCTYCDTVAPSLPETCGLEMTPGRRDFVNIPNPVKFEQIVSHLDRWKRGWPGIHHSISITGGEPLQNTDILKSLLPHLSQLFPLYLETNGVLHRELGLVIDFLDEIGMDIKLPSVSGCTDLWNCHRHFLEVATKKKVFIKVVIGSETEDWEIEKAAGIVAAVNDQLPFILQPVTLPTGRLLISPLRTLELQEMSSRYLRHVRVVPQTHKFLGQL